MEWDSFSPVKLLPDNIRDLFTEEAGYLLHDLNNNRLEVVLISAPDPRFSGHKIRAIQNENPEWYKQLYHSYKHFRRDRSLKALNRIRKLEDRPFRVSPYKYDAIYRHLIYTRLTEGYKEMGDEIPADNEARYFFKAELTEEIT